MSEETTKEDAGKFGLERHRYLSYLIRIWRRQGVKHKEWLASAESVRSHERRSFADLPSLYAFLDAQTQSDDADDEK